MSSKIPLLALPILCLCFPAFPAAAPVRKGARVGNPYYPTQVGAKRTYVQYVKDCKHVTLEEITDVQKQDDGLLVTTERSSPEGEKYGTEQYLVTENTVSRVAMGGHKFEPPFCVLKLPKGKEEAWEWESVTTFLGHKSTWHCRATRGHEVKTPAGTFSTIRVALQVDGESEPLTYKWFGLRGGDVKQTHRGDTSTTLLESFKQPSK